MTIKEKIINCLEEIGCDMTEHREGKETNCFEKLELSSYEFVLLIVTIEEKFNIEFPAEMLNINLVSSLEFLSSIVEKLLINSSESDWEGHDGR